MAGDAQLKGSWGRRGWLIASAIVLFLIVDAGLIYAAVSSRSGTAPSSAPSALPSPSMTEPSNPVDAVPAPVLAPTSRLISAFDDQVAWRATVGSCPDTDVIVERTTDGGRTWDGFDLGSTGGLSSTIGLSALDDRDSVNLIATEKINCASANWVETTSAGESWASFPDRTTSAWYIDPSNPAVIQAPGAARTAPCLEVVAIAPQDESNAAALCSDQSVHRTNDNGVTWVAVSDLSDTLAIGSGPQGYLVAMRSPDATCIGYAVAALPVSTSEKASPSSGCVPSGGVNGSALAISGASNSWWIWTGSSVQRTVDGGKTWE